MVRILLLLGKPMASDFLFKATPAVGGGSDSSSSHGPPDAGGSINYFGTSSNVRESSLGGVLRPDF